jgi:hypothetical protein
VKKQTDTAMPKEERAEDVLLFNDCTLPRLDSLFDLYSTPF